MVLGNVGERELRADALAISCPNCGALPAQACYHPSHGYTATCRARIGTHRLLDAADTIRRAGATKSSVVAFTKFEKELLIEAAAKLEAMARRKPGNR